MEYRVNSFLYTALFCNVIYLCVQFEVTSFYTLEVMPRTKIHSKNFKRAITQKKKKWNRVMVLVHCNFLKRD